jgi:hypothetical protein
MGGRDPHRVYYSKLVYSRDTLTIMKKRFIIIGIVVFMLLSGAVGVFFFKTQNKQSQKVNAAPSPTPAEEKRTLWDDPAGFSFTYDPSLVVDSHPEDQENYAHVELSKLGQEGTITVWASDTTAQTLPVWISGQKRFQKTSTMDTTLGGQPAIKINGAQTSGIMTIGALYDGLVFYIDKNGSGSAFLSDEFDKIADSFVFKPTEETQNDQQTIGGNETVFDEEETVE